MSLLEEFVILIDNSYFNVILIEAQGKDRKGTTERRTRQSYKFTHSSLLTLASYSGKILSRCLRNFFSERLE